MYRVTQQFDFPAAHVLSRHPGRCRFLHGHNYRIEITLVAEDLDEKGMVCDFHVLRTLLAEDLDVFDHSLLLNSEDQASRLAHSHNPRCVLIANRDPTSEVLAQTLFERLSARLRAGGTVARAGVEYTINPKIRLEKVRVWESPTAWAEYQP